jgi:DNA anti-recombination protein RmuC
MKANLLVVWTAVIATAGWIGCKPDEPATPSFSPSTNSAAERLREGARQVGGAAADLAAEQTRALQTRLAGLSTTLETKLEALKEKTGDSVAELRAATEKRLAQIKDASARLADATADERAKLAAGFKELADEIEGWAKNLTD